MADCMLNLDHNISRDEEVVATGKRKEKGIGKKQ